MQGILINLVRVCRSALTHFEPILSRSTSDELTALVTLCIDRLAVGNFADTKTAKLACITKNINSVARVKILHPVSWTLAPGHLGLSCLKFSLCCLGYHREELCPLCGQLFKGLSHFFLEC